MHCVLWIWVYLIYEATAQIGCCRFLRCATTWNLQLCKIVFAILNAICLSLRHYFDPANTSHRASCFSAGSFFYYIKLTKSCVRILYYPIYCELLLYYYSPSYKKQCIFAVPHCLNALWLQNHFKQLDFLYPTAFSPIGSVIMIYSASFSWVIWKLFHKGYSSSILHWHKQVH